MITMSREELLKQVRSCTPAMDFEDKYPNLFGKYGHMFCYTYDKWIWFDEENISDFAKKEGKKPLNEATDMELLEMLVLASSYWLKNYENWFEKSKRKSSKLDNFIGNCELAYFGYGDEYTEETIDTIFNKIYDILDEKFKIKKDL